MTEAEAVARFDALIKQCSADIDELKRAVAEHGIDWLITHYHSALINWSCCMDEIDELRAKLKEYEQKADA